MFWFLYSSIIKQHFWTFDDVILAFWKDSTTMKIMLSCSPTLSAMLCSNVQYLIKNVKIFISCKAQLPNVVSR